MKEIVSELIENCPACKRLGNYCHYHIKKAQANFLYLFGTPEDILRIIK